MEVLARFEEAHVQRRRRASPYPHTWEVPLALAVGVLATHVIGVQIGRALANGLAGNGWIFVDQADLLTSLPGVLAGRADAGLVGLTSPASPPLLWGCIVAVETLVLVISGLVLQAGWRRWGSSRVEGTATRPEIEGLLGVARLRRHATVIRPDLYASRLLSRPMTRPHTKSARIAGLQEEGS
jgi:hypothetical protein